MTQADAGNYPEAAKILTAPKTGRSPTLTPPHRRRSKSSFAQKPTICIISATKSAAAAALAAEGYGSAEQTDAMAMATPLHAPWPCLHLTTHILIKRKVKKTLMVVSRMGSGRWWEMQGGRWSYTALRQGPMHQDSSDNLLPCVSMIPERYSILVRVLVSSFQK